MNTGNRLIHVARYSGDNDEEIYLYLREIDAHRYQWFQETPEGAEAALPLESYSAEEAIRLAANKFHYHEFAPVECGFRYDLSDRDEHGINALFYQMVDSYSSANIDGAYFDPTVGHMCYVDFASDEALDLWYKLREEGRL